MKKIESKKNNSYQNPLRKSFVKEQLSEFYKLFCINIPKISDENNITPNNSNTQNNKFSILGASFINNPFEGNISRIIEILVLKDFMSPPCTKRLKGYELDLFIACLSKNPREINNLIEDISNESSNTSSDSDIVEEFNYSKIISYALYLATFFCDYEAAEMLLNKVPYFNKEECPDYINYLNISLYYFGTFYTGNYHKDANANANANIEIQDFLDKNLSSYQKTATLLIRKGADINTPFLGEQSIYLKMIFSIYSEEYLISMLDAIIDVNVENKTISKNNNSLNNIDYKTESIPSYLMGAIGTKKPNLTNALVERGGDINFSIKHSEEYVEYVVVCAASAGPEYLKYILKSLQELNLNIKDIDIHNKVSCEDYSYLDLINCTKEAIKIENELIDYVTRLNEAPIVLTNSLIDIITQYTQYKNKFNNTPVEYQNLITTVIPQTSSVLIKYLDQTASNILASLLVCKENPTMLLNSEYIFDSKYYNKTTATLPKEIWQLIGKYTLQNCITSKTNMTTYKSGDKIFDNYMKNLSSFLDASSLFYVNHSTTMKTDEIDIISEDSVHTSLSGEESYEDLESI